MAYIQRLGDNKWRIYLSAGWDPVRKRYARTTRVVSAPRKKDAEAIAADLLRDIGRGFMDPGHMTFGELLDLWLSDHVSGLRPKTRLWYDANVQRHLKPALGDVRLTKLTPLHLQQYLNSIRRLDRMQGVAQPSASTLRAHYRTLHAALGRAVKWKLIPVNPADDIKPVARTVPRMEVLGPEKVQALLDAARHTGNYALYLAAQPASARGSSWRWPGMTSTSTRARSEFGAPCCGREPNRLSARPRPPPAPATMLLLAQVPTKVVSEGLGHSGTGITQDLYYHVLKPMQKEAADAMDRLFGRTKG